MAAIALYAAKTAPLGECAKHRRKPSGSTFAGPNAADRGTTTRRLTSQPSTAGAETGTS